MNFNPLVVSIANATPLDRPKRRASIWWAVFAVWLIGILVGHFWQPAADCPLLQF